MFVLQLEQSCITDTVWASYSISKSFGCLVKIMINFAALIQKSPFFISDVFIPSHQSLIVNLKESKEVDCLFLWVCVCVRACLRFTFFASFIHFSLPSSIFLPLFPTLVLCSPCHILSLHSFIFFLTPSSFSFPVGDGPADLPACHVQPEQGDPQCPGSCITSSFQTHVTYRGPHISVPDSVANPGCRPIAISGRPQSALKH